MQLTCCLNEHVILQVRKHIVATRRSKQLLKLINKAGGLEFQFFFNHKKNHELELIS